MKRDMEHGKEISDGRLIRYLQYQMNSVSEKLLEECSVIDNMRSELVYLRHQSEEGARERAENQSHIRKLAELITRQEEKYTQLKE